MNRTVPAPYKTPRCRFNEKGIWKQYSERHPSQPGVLWRVLGRMCGHDRMGGRCRTNGAPGTRVGSAAARQPQAIAAAASHCNFTSHATSIVCRDFRPNHTEQRAIAAPRAFNGLCDDEGVPLICPTCQVLPPKASLPAPACYFAWGCFRYFCWEPQRRGAAARILLEAAHASEAFAVAKCRTISAQNCEPKVVFPFAVQRIGDFVIELTTRSVF